MLKRLTIRNFAVIEAISVEFKDGLNLLTGETGSGKSIIVDALGLLLGDRGSFSQIRTGEKSAFVEGIFEIDGSEVEDVRTILDEAGVYGQDEDDELVIRREVVSGGKTRIFINDRSIGVSILRALQPFLVEIHGQGEQKLLRSKRAQLDLLDAYAGCQTLRKEVGEAFAQFKGSLTALEALRTESSMRERNLELLQHQLSEIDAISPREGEDEELARERLVMANAERILETCSAAYNELYESDRSVLSTVAGITRRIRELVEMDSRLDQVLSSLDEGAALFSEAAESLRTYIDSVDFSQEEFARVDNRLAEIERIKRKFDADLPGIIEMRKILEQKLETLVEHSEQEAQLVLHLDTSRSVYIENASELTKLRRAAVGKLEREIGKELPKVALQHAKLSIALESAEAELSVAANSAKAEFVPTTDESAYFSPYGADQVAFLFSANPGEDLRPLSQVASGGELSRLMLTLLTVSLKSTAKNAEGATVIFDEIDSGIGGSVAEAVGRRLKFLAKTGQVLCVTHQPQIARFADAHYLVQKGIVKGRTITTVELLDQEERVREVARMIAGDHEEQTTLETARWMVESTGTK